MADIQTQLPVKLTDNTNTAQITTAGGGALQVDGSSVTQPVSGTVTANQGTANTSANAWPVKISDGTDTVGISTVGGSSKALKVDVIQTVESAAFVDNSAFTAGTTNLEVIGGVFNDGLSAVTSGNAAAPRITSSRALHVNLRNNTGTEIGTASNPVRIDPTGTTTQPISGTVTANAGTGNYTVNLAQIAGSSIATAATGIIKVGMTDSNGASITLGQKVMASSIPVVIASDQSAYPVSAAQNAVVTGTITTSSSTVAASCTNMAWATITVQGTYAGVNFAFQLSDDSGTTYYPVQATRSDGTAVETSTGVLTANTSRMWFVALGAATNIRVAASAYTSGTANIRITLANVPNTTSVVTSVVGSTSTNIAQINGSTVSSAATGVIKVGISDSSGANITLGQKVMASSVPVVIASDQSTINITGTGSAGTPASGVVTIQGIASMTAVKVDGSAVTQPVSGTVTANIGTTNGLALDTSVNGILVTQGSTTSGQKGPLIQGAVTTAAPTYTTGQTNALSLTTAGALRVDGSGVTQPVSGTVTANAGTGNFGVNITQVAGSSVATAATGVIKVGITDSSGNAISLGQQTMAASVPVTIASNQSALSVNSTPSEVSTGIVAFQNTVTAVANNSTGTVTYTVTAGKTLYLKQIIAAASGGPCKVTVDYGAGPTRVAVLFFSAAQPYVSINFAQPISIAAATAVNVKIQNNAGSAQDVYASIIGREI